MEVPIAVPLRMPSTEERRRHEADLERGGRYEDDEMDIAAMISSAPVEHDLLGFSPPGPAGRQLPSISRFGMPAQPQPPPPPPPPASAPAARRDGAGDEESDASSLRSNGIRSGSQSIKSEPHVRPYRHHQSRVSYDAGMMSRNGRPGRRPRVRRGSHTTGQLAFPYHDDDDDDDDERGDLGYSAVTGSEGARRKVIAERLETVKSRNPVFTWC